MTPKLELAIHQAAVIALPVFRQHKWEWASSKSSDRVPNLEEIVAFLTNLAQRFEQPDLEWTSCGRFTMRRDEDGDIDIYLDVGSTIDYYHEEEARRSYYDDW